MYGLGVRFHSIRNRLCSYFGREATAGGATGAAMVPWWCRCRFVGVCWCFVKVLGFCGRGNSNVIFAMVRHFLVAVVVPYK